MAGHEHGISPTTFYKWKAKYGGLDVSDARKLKSLETENARLPPGRRRYEDGAGRAPAGQS